MRFACVLALAFLARSLTHSGSHYASPIVHSLARSLRPSLTGSLTHNAAEEHTDEQELDCPGHRTRNATHRAGTAVNKSEVAQDTAHATPRTERAHRRTGAKWPRGPHTLHNTPSRHTGEQEPSGPGHRTRNTTHRAGTPVNRSQVAQKTAHTTQRTEWAHRGTAAKLSRTPHTQHNTAGEHTGEQEPSGPGHRTRNATYRVGTPVNRSQVAQDTAHAPQCNTWSEQTGGQEPSNPGHRTGNATHGASTPVNRSQVAQDTARASQYNTRSEQTGEQEPTNPGHRTHNTTHGASTPVNRGQVAQDTAHATRRRGRPQR